jgi:hypothetical protein
VRSLSRYLSTLLLPPESRESLLGDLEERGYQLRDLLSLLRAAWSTAIRRRFAIPDYRRATDAAIQHRAQQFYANRTAALVFCLGANGLSVIIRSLQAPGSVNVGLTLLLFFVVIAARASARHRLTLRDRGEALEQHRRQLSAPILVTMFGLPYVMLMAAILRLVPHDRSWNIPVLLLALPYGLYRASRFRAELAALDRAGIRS